MAVKMAVLKDETMVVQMAPWMVVRMAASKGEKKVVQMAAKTVEWDLKMVVLSAEKKAAWTVVRMAV